MIWAYWAAVKRSRSAHGRSEVERFGGKPGQLAGLWRAAGLRDVEDGLDHGVRPPTATSTSSGRRSGPASARSASTPSPSKADALDAVREAFRRNVGSPDGAFELTATAWFAAGTV